MLWFCNPLSFNILIQLATYNNKIKYNEKNKLHSFLQKSYFLISLTFVVLPFGNKLMASNTDCPDCKVFTYHFQNDIARTVATAPCLLF